MEPCVISAVAEIVLKTCRIHIKFKRDFQSIELDLHVFFATDFPVSHRVNRAMTVSHVWASTIFSVYLNLSAALLKRTKGGEAGNMHSSSKDISIWD